MKFEIFKNLWFNLKNYNERCKKCWLVNMMFFLLSLLGGVFSLLVWYIIVGGRGLLMLFCLEIVFMDR